MVHLKTVNQDVGSVHWVMSEAIAEVESEATMVNHVNNEDIYKEEYLKFWEIWDFFPPSGDYCGYSKQIRAAFHCSL